MSCGPWSVVCGLIRLIQSLFKAAGRIAEITKEFLLFQKNRLSLPVHTAPISAGRLKNLLAEALQNRGFS